VLRTRHGAPQPLTPSAAYGPPLEKILWTPLASPMGFLAGEATQR